MMYGDVNAFELLFPVLVLIVLGLVIFVAVRAGVGRAGSGGAASAVGRRGRSRAVEILDERYARGELTLEEYRERLQALGEDG